MDILKINQLRCDVTLGIHNWEQQIKQPIMIDMALQIDNTAVAAANSLHASPDYAQLTHDVQMWLQQTSHHLLETLSEQLANWLRDHTQCAWLQLTVTKPHALPNASSVSICLERIFK